MAQGSDDWKRLFSIEGTASSAITWLEPPVDFRSFVELPAYSNNFPLSEVQYLEVMKLFGPDPKLIFSKSPPRKYKEMVALWGKGSLSRVVSIYCEDSGTWETVESLVSGGSRFVRGIDIKNCKIKSENNQEVKKVDGFWVEAPAGKIYEVETCSGLKIRVQEDHRFYTRGRYSCGRVKKSAFWKTLKEISPGDSLAVTARVGILNPVELPECEIKLVAYLVAEGSLPNTLISDYRLSFSNTSSILLSDYEKSFHELGIFKYGKWIDSKNRVATKTSIVININQNEVVNGFVTKYELINKKSGNKRIPKQIFSLSDTQLALFLSRLFAGDGWVCSDNKTYSEVGYSSKNYDLCLDVHRLLLRFGIFSRISKHTVGKYINWQTKINHRDDICRFLNEIGIYGLEEKCHRVLEYEQSRGKQHKSCGADNRRIGDVVWTRIKSITYVGEEEYYDTNVPDIENYVANGFFNHNSGKGLVSCLVANYVIYLLLCMENPHMYFGIASQDPLYFVNVATGQDQANKLFSRIYRRLLGTKWFTDRFKIYKQGKLVRSSGKFSPSWGEVQISADEIQFPRGLAMKSLHSQNEKWEGLNIIGFIADEMSGFLTQGGQFNADSIYNTVTTSTRELPYIGLITSFPRGSEDTDFVYGLYKRAVDGKLPGITASRYYTWEVKPSRIYSGETFKFMIDERTGKTEQVPIEYRDQALRNPEGFKKRYMCICGGTGELGDFFEYQNRFSAIAYRSNKIEDKDEVVMEGGTPIIKKIMLKQTLNLLNTHHITLDCGETESEAAMTVSHRDGSKAVIDAILIWRPDPERGIIVDLKNYQGFALELARLLHAPVRFDHWNAAAIESFLRSNGVQTERKNVAFNEYTKMKSVLYSGNLILPQCENSDKFIGQCKSLKTRTQLKPRVANGRQDACDAVVQAIDVLFADEEMQDMEVGVAFEFGGKQGADLKRQAENVFGLKRDFGRRMRKEDSDDMESDDIGMIV